MKKFKLIYLLLAAPLFLNVSCGKDEEPEPTYKKPVASERNIVVEVPTGLQNSTDPNASMAISWMEVANGLAAFNSMFTVPSNAQTGTDKSSSTVYYWSGGGFSYWMTYAELADKYTWKYEFSTPTIPRFTYIQAEELKTGKQGSWAINSPEVGHAVLWDYNWNINTANDFSAIMVWYGDSSSDEIRFEVLDKADNSGYFKAYIENVKFVDIIWNSNGTGSWWYSLGVTYQGTW